MNTSLDTSSLTGEEGLPLMRQSFPGLDNLLQEVFGCFEGVVRYYFSLPEELRDRYAILEAGDEDPDLGFVYRRAGGHDRKLFFHYRPEVPEQITDPALTRFFQLCHRLYVRALKETLKVVQELENRNHQRLRGLTESVIPDSRHRLRLLWYENNSGDLAQRHYDQGFLTNHLGATHSGLLIEHQKRFYSVEEISDQSCVFAGRKAPQVTGGIIAGALCHAVVSDGLPAGKNLGHRMAAVFFLHGPLRSSAARQVK